MKSYRSLPRISSYVARLPRALFSFHAEKLSLMARCYIQLEYNGSDVIMINIMAKPVLCARETQAHGGRRCHCCISQANTASQSPFLKSAGHIFVSRRRVTAYHVWNEHVYPPMSDISMEESRGVHPMGASCTHINGRDVPSGACRSVVCIWAKWHKR